MLNHLQLQKDEPDRDQEDLHEDEGAGARQDHQRDDPREPASV